MREGEGEMLTTDGNATDVTNTIFFGECLDSNNKYFFHCFLCLRLY